MKCFRFKRCIAYLLACFQVMLSWAVFGVSPIYAQTLDTEPPRLEIDTVDEAGKGDSQDFTATATDNQGIDSVILFYRLDADSQFQDAPMVRSGDSDQFSFTLTAENIPPSASAIQYYIEAKDTAGNRVLRGFSFDPLERLLIDPSDALASNNIQEDTESTSLLSSFSTGQKIVLGIAGIIVVGALVSAGSSSSGGGAPAGPTVPVTIISEPISVFR